MNHNQQENNIVSDIQLMVSEARRRVAVSANATITILYWHIGERINRDILGNQRAEYGKRVVEELSLKLKHEFGGNEF